ncbi:MAG: cytochrome c3 family protein [Vicinamibacteria bacterium]
MKTGKIPQQVVVLSAIAIVVVVVFFGMRALFVPESFGKYGHYRADAVDAVAKLPIHYAGAKTCAECHDDVEKVKSAGFHRSVSCEVCHGPGAAHVEDPGTVKPTAPRQRDLCPLCHNYSPSRPTGFPQIVTAQHNPGKPCMTCHKPHDPVPPNVPKECSACHRGITNQKQVSPHASLECTTCHQVPKEHSSNPRAFAVAKPKVNQACEQCHANKNAQPAGTIPQVAPEHSGRYLCWDCHYPHFPEGKK